MEGFPKHKQLVIWVWGMFQGYVGIFLECFKSNIAWIHRSPRMQSWRIKVYLGIPKPKNYNKPITSKIANYISRRPGIPLYIKKTWCVTIASVGVDLKHRHFWMRTPLPNNSDIRLVNQHSNGLFCFQKEIHLQRVHVPASYVSLLECKKWWISRNHRI